MNKTKALVNGALLSVIAMGLSLGSVEAFAEKPEKCQGIVKASKNDCGNGKHSCAGQATEDGAADEWIYVPAGTCERIVGGTVKK